MGGLSLENNYPCVCGHERKYHHDYDGSCHLPLPCWYGLDTKQIDKFCTECRIYRPDNLRYLEQQYEYHNK